MSWHNSSLVTEVSMMNVEYQVPLGFRQVLTLENKLEIAPWAK